MDFRRKNVSEFPWLRCAPIELRFEYGAPVDRSVIALSAFGANFNFDDANRNTLTVLKIETGESASITEVPALGLSAVP